MVSAYLAGLALHLAVLGERAELGERLERLLLAADRAPLRQRHVLDYVCQLAYFCTTI